MRLAELCSALALASDAGSALPAETSLRTTLIAMALTKGLPSEDRRVVYYAALLRHIGCTASAHEETRWMGDDHELKSMLAFDELSLAEMARGFAKGKNPFTKAARIVRFMSGASTVAPIAFRSRCEVAARFAVRMGLAGRVERALQQAYERFDGKGQPVGLKGDAITIEARWIAVAEVAALAFSASGVNGAIDAVRARRGTFLDPLLVDAFLADPHRMLSEVALPSLLEPALEAEPNPHSNAADDRVLAIAEVIADFADLKSTYTLGHSRGVADLAWRAGKAMNLPDERLKELRFAALMHDVGRVAVSNAIWDKRGHLDAGEREQIHSHTFATDRVLGHMESLKLVSRLASQAHERIDGSGYHRNLPATAIGTASRILAVADVAQALTEPRPHRSAFRREEAGKILIQLSRNGQLDPRAVDAVIVAMGARPEREASPISAVARGSIEPDAKLLAKIGVTTRAAAALYAMEHDLLA